MKLRFVQGTLQNAKQEPSRGVCGMPPKCFWKLPSLWMNLMPYKAQIIMLREGFGKFAVRKNSLAMYAWGDSPIEGGQEPP